MSIRSIVGRTLVRAAHKLGEDEPKPSSSEPDIYLHKYDSYEQYKKVQIFHNKRKLTNVWADDRTLDILVARVQTEFGPNSPLFALCHGTRNGYEQNYLAQKLNVDIVGTDISDTASKFPRSIQWDFHDPNPQWINRCQFVYTNSLDQSWKPQSAVETWLDQLIIGGLLFIEHTESHGPKEAGEMDPFGAKPQYMPYLLCEWFGHRISVEIIRSVKANLDRNVWLFVVKKLS